MKKSKTIIMKTIKKFGIAYTLFLMLVLTFAIQCNRATVDSTLPWSERLAQSDIIRFPEAWKLDFNRAPKWGYTQGLELLAMQKLMNATNKSIYRDYINVFYDMFIDSTGSIMTYNMEDYNIDRINAGKPLFQLYQDTGEERYKNAIFTLREQMKTHPRIQSGGFWHKKRYTHQMWLDGLYMASPFLAQFAATFDEPELFDDVANQILLMEHYARDEKTGLLYHGYDDSRTQKWADPVTGLSPHFWGRAIGWYAMAIVDVLDFMPEDHPKQPEIIETLRRLAAAIAKFQDKETGLWYQVMNEEDREGNYQEATASCMFVYTLKKALRKGYLNRDFQAVAQKGYDGILEHFIKIDKYGKVDLTTCCAVAGLGGEPYRDGSYDYYVSTHVRDNDPKGVGPFILASLEFESET